MEDAIKSIEKEYKFQKIEWPVFRVGWVIMAVFLITGIAGLFGSGALSERKEENTEASVEYEQLLRYSVESKVFILLKKPLADSTLSINADYIKAMKIDKVIPEPIAMELNDSMLKYRFANTDIEEISLILKPIDTGKKQLKLHINGTESVFNQYIFF